MCHLANIASRTGETLHCDSSKWQAAVEKRRRLWWNREYEQGWEIKV